MRFVLVHMQSQPQMHTGRLRSYAMLTNKDPYSNFYSFFTVVIHLEARRRHNHIIRYIEHIIQPSIEWSLHCDLYSPVIFLTISWYTTVILNFGHAVRAIAMRWYGNHDTISELMSLLRGIFTHRSSTILEFPQLLAIT
jgi:hypothetical protein